MSCVGLKCILGNVWSAAVRVLDLNYNLIGDEGLEILFGVGLVNVQTLRLCDTGISGHGLIVMSNANLNQIRYLQLDQNMISKQGCQYLSKTTLPNLNSLHLSTSNNYGKWTAKQECKGSKHYQNHNFHVQNNSKLVDSIMRVKTLMLMHLICQDQVTGKHQIGSIFVHYVVIFLDQGSMDLVAVWALVKVKWGIKAMKGESYSVVHISDSLRQCIQQVKKIKYGF